MAFLAGWFGNASGSEALEAAPGPDRPGDAAAETGTDRRNRDAAPAESQVRDVVALKVLHGWLQNRHQTLMPLSVNLVRLGEADRDLVARFAALAALSGGDRTAPDRLRTWLASVGADGAALSAFSDALAEPPALPRCMADLARPDLAPLAFVAALVGARDGGPASRLFADYVAARLTLPNAAIRSAERRYRA